ncbi:glutamate--tRNA ligase, putative [Perkinsus marinus ATCC 50983]|uniref:glutamate--tRNA ligase n=1 Tax=Perkinsus marinus (strain ATCC 50983 / TXsc) TaxID=423536 RepID=C5K744_PERM5|nr:glutamate--tRNA ligase, putative [Perkinsus marinus ATCC 50983]EER19379.1 glutamate--tRNA ligase, putative [Perkinsus marinus ATCC 50983]|eukprot:XP_002787583.1 glutamate--tRNA ligase, putative [Perkinsus marinus ATCC 50983]
MTLQKIVVNTTLSGYHSPLTSLIASALVNLVNPNSVIFRHVEKIPRAPESATLSVMINGATSILNSDLSLARFIASAAPSSYGLYTPSPQMEAWLDLVDNTQKLGNDTLKTINDELALKTYLIGNSLTLADAAVWALIARSGGASRLKPFPHVSRWWKYLEAQPAFITAMEESKNSSHQKSSSAATAGKEEKKGKGKDQANLENKLPGAEMGKVVTRFPPEPSGYLHIGHAKAALLNDYYARAYKGKLIIRFDDTNPAKEKAEYEQSIIEDLGMLGIHGDQLTHTSDNFPLLQKYMEKMIKMGKAYVDDTPVDVMREERSKGVESKCRNRSVDDNIALWHEMLNGTEVGQTCVVRAKISMTHKNRCMRDPTFYRVITDVPHHKYGFQYKAYPTYDFCCPIIDSIEGVTHALRTIEYADRNEQYHWVIDTLGLRNVTIYEFSRSNFVHTLLSKRKLTWFVDNGYVSGWDDPRFPTVRGVLRHGMTVDALRDFVLTQGASKAGNLMEWDKIWTINKQKIDSVVPRYAAVGDDAVELLLEGAPTTPTGKDEPKHPKNPSLGKRLIMLSDHVLIDAGDAAELQKGEEVTLMHWGNAVIDEITKVGDKVTSLKGHLHLEGSVKTTKKKLQWVAKVDNLAHLKLRELDYLITKRKVEDDDNVEDLVNPNSEVDVMALGDPLIAATLKKGDRIQLERKGYFIVDKIPMPSNGNVMTLINIPDGKTKTMTGDLRTGVDVTSSSSPEPSRDAKKQ